MLAFYQTKIMNSLRTIEQLKEQPATFRLTDGMAIGDVRMTGVEWLNRDELIAKEENRLADHRTQAARWAVKT